MADETKRKVNYRLYGLRSLYYMPVHTKTHLFEVFVLPHFDYILSLSAYWTAGIVDQLEKVYNRALKQTLNMTIKFMDRDAQLKGLSPLNIMPFHHRRLYRLSLCVHRVLNGDYLPAVKQKLVWNSSNRYNLRQCASRNLLKLSVVPKKRLQQTLVFFISNFINNYLRSSYTMNAKDFKYFIISNLFLFN
jgi:hypothetical protein